jgi:Ni,Fe-hydrogenase I cytochrome b subunit
MKNILFPRTYSRAIRLWHWTTFIVIGLLLYSVFVAKFFLNPFSTSPTIHQTMTQMSISDNNNASFNIGNALSANVWKWHIRYGYVLTALFIVRLIIEVFQPGTERLSARIRKSFLFVRKKETRRTAFHYLVVQITYVLFYLLIGLIIATGLWLSFNSNTKNAELAHSVKEFHQACFFLILFFILLHLAGIILNESREHSNIVSRMINGG